MRCFLFTIIFASSFITAALTQVIGQEIDYEVFEKRYMSGLVRVLAGSSGEVSGFLISEEGLVLTDYEFIKKHKKDDKVIVFYTGNTNTIRFSVLLKDKKRGFAVLKLNTYPVITHNKPLPLANNSLASYGNELLMLAKPLGGEFPTPQSGRIRKVSEGKSKEVLFETDFQGLVTSTGLPIFNTYGYVVGMFHHSYSISQGGRTKPLRAVGIQMKEITDRLDKKRIKYNQDIYEAPEETYPEDGLIGNAEESNSEDDYQTTSNEEQGSYSTGKYRDELKRVEFRIGGGLSYSAGLASVGFDFSQFRLDKESWYLNSSILLRVGINDNDRGHSVGLFCRYGKSTRFLVGNLQFTELELGVLFKEWFRVSGGIGIQNFRYNIPLFEEIETTNYGVFTVGFAPRFTRFFELNLNAVGLYNFEIDELALRTDAGIVIRFGF